MLSLEFENFPFHPGASQGGVGTHLFLNASFTFWYELSFLSQLKYKLARFYVFIAEERVEGALLNSWWQQVSLLLASIAVQSNLSCVLHLLHCSRFVVLWFHSKLLYTVNNVNEFCCSLGWRAAPLQETLIELRLLSFSLGLCGRQAARPEVFHMKAEQLKPHCSERHSEDCAPLDYHKSLIGLKLLVAGNYRFQKQ